jgi:hypothetical protein
MTGTVIGAGILLIILGNMLDMPGTIVSILFFWVFYFACGGIKGNIKDYS